jgi:hypothetical protein
VKPRSVLACLAVSVAIATSVASASGGANSEHKLAIHVKSHPTSCTAGYPTFASCGQITSTYGSCGDVDVMPVFFDLTEYRLNEFGLEWPVQWGTMSWVRCRGVVAVGTIARSGEGTAIAWSTCQRTWSIAPGLGWLAPTSPGRVCPIRNPATDDWGTVDCAPDPGPYYDYPVDVYCAGICGAAGDDPCNQPGSAGSTWGGIKSMFK